MRNLNVSAVVLATGLSIVTSFGSFAGGIKAYPMNLKGVQVGVPSIIHIENTGDKANTLTAMSGNDNIIVYPPVIENIEPTQKSSFYVAFAASDMVAEDDATNYVVIRIADGGSFRILVKK